MKPTLLILSILLLTASTTGLPTPDTLEGLYELFDRADDHIAEVGFDAWEAHLRGFLDFYSEEHGPDSPMYGLTCLNLASVLRVMGQLHTEEVWELLSTAETIFSTQEHYDEFPLGYISLWQGAVLQDQADFKGSIPYFKKATELLERSAGPESEIFATSLSYHSWSLVETQEDLEAAKELAIRGLEVRDALGQTDHVNASFHHWQLGEIAEIQGRFRDALRHFERCLEIRDSYFQGADSHWTASVLVEMGWADFMLGRHARAEERSLEAYRVLKDAGQAGARAYAAVLNNLGALYQTQGRVDRGLAMFRQAQSERKPFYADDHDYVLATELNIARALNALGRPDEALERSARALDLMRKKYQHHDTIEEALWTISASHLAKQEYPQAMASLHEADSVGLSLRGHPHPVTRLAMAGVALKQADVGLAEKILNEVAEAQSADTSPFTSWHITSQQSEVYVAQNRFDEASVLLHAVVAEQNGLGLDAQHPARIETESRLALAEMARGNSQAAFAAAASSQRRLSQKIGTLAPGLPEASALRYITQTKREIQLILSILDEGGMTPEQVATAWALTSGQRSLVMRTLLERRRAVVQQEYPHASQWEAVSLARRDLAHVFMRFAKDPDSEALREELRQARARRESAEESLAAALGQEEIPSAAQEVAVEQLSRAISPQTALVAFVQYEKWRAGYLDWTSYPLPTGEDFYGAFILSAGDSEPRFVSLGPASAVDAAVETWSEEANQGERMPGRSPRGAQRAYVAAAEAAWELVWQPAQRYLTGATEVLWIPDGTLHRLNPAAMIVDDAYWVESGISFHRLATEHDLLTPESSSSAGLLAIGDVAYAESEPPPEGATSRAMPCIAELTSGFARLPASGLEVDLVEASWPTDDSQVLKGTTATEPAFYRDAPGRQVIHLATHAFFLDEDCSDQMDALEFNDSPLVRSGLVLSKTDEAGHDGFLTAEEIATLDLAGTERVVLSACHTSAGEVTAGEGSMGLVRSFQVAGVEQVVMSLWPVGDQSTAEFMDAYYQSGASVSDAQRARLARLRSSQSSDHPAQWAGFVSTGRRRSARP